AGDAAALTAGEAVYAGSCASCHGAAGAGDGLVSDPPPTDFTAGDEERCDGLMFWRISTGAATGPAGSIMAAYGGALTDDQIWQVVTFLRTFEP
ncbi:cytochrome c, partial [bacterium]|nr:cytochrome c [bacterium]